MSAKLDKKVHGIPGRGYEMILRGRQYCVYAHVYDGEVFYIGSGFAERPFHCTSRTPQWWEYVRAIPSYTIEILGYYSERTQALAEEGRLLQALRPVCNVRRVGITKRIS